MSSPTQRSLKLLRSRGYLVAIVEKWNPYVKIRQDLFGFIDLVAIKGNETLGVQTTTRGDINRRMEKIRNLPAAKFWADSSTRKIIVHGWAIMGAKGKRKKYECREIEMTLADFEQAEIEIVKV